MSTPRGKRHSCRDCQHFRATAQGPRCRFRGGRPSGVCAVFRRAAPPAAP